MYRRFFSVLCQFFIFFSLSSQSIIPYKWNTICIGGGGFVSGIITSSSIADQVFIRTDVGGAYRWNSKSQSWIALTDMLGENELGFMGVESIALDPNNPNKLYIAAGTEYWNNGKSAILISNNNGNTFEVIDVSDKFHFHGNGIGRGGGERLVVSPTDSDVLFCGTRADGLWKSTDGARSWKKVESFPTQNLSRDNGITSVFFDNRTLIGGKKEPAVYVTTSTIGDYNFFVSYDEGNSWQYVEDARTDYIIQQVAQTGDGTLYLCYANGCPPHPSSLGKLTEGAIMKYDIDTSKWYELTPDKVSRPYSGVSICKDNPLRLIVSTTNTYNLQCWHNKEVYGDELFRSIDGGKTWTKLFEERKNRFNKGQFIWGNELALHWASDIEIDPFNSNRAWVVSGNGLFMTNNLWDDTVMWNFQVNGIEETVPTDLVSPTDGAFLLSAIGDYDGFRHVSMDISPSEGRFYPHMGTTSSITCASLQPQVVVRSGNSGSVGACYSEDNGRTWKLFESYPIGKGKSYGGNVVISADGKIILWRTFIKGDRRPKIYFTKNMGKTWSLLENVPDDLILVADAVDGNVFYGYNDKNGNIYCSKDGGETFQLVSKMFPHAGRMRTVPGYKGTLLLPQSNGLWMSEDYGLNWMKIKNVTYAESVGLGKSFSKKDFPIIYICGIINGEKGIYLSDDKGLTWMCISNKNKKFGGLGNAKIIIGDMQTPGRIYLSTAGRGIVYGEPSSNIEENGFMKQIEK